MKMNEIRVRMDEWFFTQALVGYKNILDAYGEKVKTTYDGIIVEKQHLEKMADAFFSFYLNEYSVVHREERILRGLHKQFKEGKKGVKTPINQRLNAQKKSANRYFKDTKEGVKLAEFADLYRKQKKYSPEMDEWMNGFIEMLHTDDIDEKLTSNFFKAVHLRPHFGQTSFLNVTHNRKTLEEQKDIFRKDFIDPIIAEWNLYESLKNNDEEQVEQVFSETDYQPFNAIKRAFRKKTIEEMKEYVQKNIPKCSLTDFPFGLKNFEEQVFSPLALSLKNARNMSWNANEKEYLPISSLARLLMFCSQAGATDTQGKSVFVFYGGPFDEIYQINRSYAHFKSHNKTFDQIVFDLVREQKTKADYLKKHYVIYEYESDYQAKKTLLDYMIMTPHVVKLFSDESELFKSVHYTIKSDMIRFLLKGIDTKHFISEELRKKVKDNYPVFDMIRLIQIRHLNQIFSKGDLNVDSSIEKRRIWALVKSAEKIKYKIGLKKAQGIAYRLLNAVRSNDKHTFMDTVMRVYISSDLEMPGLLLEVLHEENMDFATVGNAWIAGLVSKPNNQKEGEKNHE